MSTPKAGEIIHVGQVLHPPYAEALGNVMLDHYETLSYQFGTVPYATDNPRLPTNYGYINEEEPSIVVSGVYQAVYDRFNELLKTRGAPTGLGIDADVVIGNPVSDWHVDPAECRLLVNLGRYPQDLLVSTAVREEEIDDSNTHTVSIVTGEGIYLDSLYDEYDRLFHKGTPSEAKVFMRMVASIRRQSTPTTT